MNFIEEKRMIDEKEEYELFLRKTLQHSFRYAILQIYKGKSASSEDYRNRRNKISIFKMKKGNENIRKGYSNSLFGCIVLSDSFPSVLLHRGPDLPNQVILYSPDDFRERKQLLRSW